MSKKFSHLHVHSEFSLLDGISKRSDLIKKAKLFGQPGIACTEHGDMYNSISFYRECMDAGIVPVIGMEAYVAPDSHLGRTYAKKGEAEEDAKNGDLSMSAYHLTILSKNRDGYENLKALSTKAFRHGFYRKPRIDDELLAAHKDGLIVLSGCLASKTSRLIVAGNEEAALQEIDKMRKLFGEDFYLEVMAHNIAEENVVRSALIDFGNRRGIGLVMTGDSHYTEHGDAKAHEIALLMNTGKTINTPDKWVFNGDGYWFKSTEEMFEVAEQNDIPLEALNNSVNIVNKIQDYGFKLVSKTKKPLIPLFRDDNGHVYSDEECHQLLELKTRTGMIERGLSGISEYETRLTEELSMIKRKNFSSYFLIIADIIDFVRKNGWPAPIGRGSSGGSLVCYTSFITGVDPIKFDIPFSRFINEGRKDLPDIDTDIIKAHRKEVVEYIASKYGIDRVAQIITFQTLAAKAAIDNVGRALDVPSSVRKQISTLIGDTDKDDRIAEIIKDNPKVKELMSQTPDWIDISIRLEGNTKNVSSHAAGIVISNEPITDYVPLGRDSTDGHVVTQYDMGDLSELGLLKLDILGLKAYDVIHQTMCMVKAKGGYVPELHAFPLDDVQTYKKVASGKFASVFQYDSSGIRAMTKSLHPENFEHLMAINALFRPGPMKAGSGVHGKSILENYIDRRHGREEAEIWHPELKELFAPTLGMPLYQEQISATAQIISGFNEVEADEFRSAIGKKDAVKYKAAIDKFVSRGIEMDRPAKFMHDLAEKLGGFARYGWNKAHDVLYSYLSFVTAYLETHHQLEYYTALLNANSDDTKDLAKLLSAIIQQGVKVLPPDVNNSGRDFTTDGKNIFMGMYSVKMIGENAVQQMLKDIKDNGPFKDYIDYCIRMHKYGTYVTKLVKENLVKAGAFDWDTSLTAKDKIETTELIQKIVKKFDGKLSHGEIHEYLLETLPLTNSEYPETQRLQLERSVLNFYITSHPVIQYQSLFGLFDGYEFIIPSEINDKDVGSRVLLIGLLEAKTMKTTAKGKPYINMKVGDNIGSRTIMIWSPLATQVFDKIQQNQLVLISGMIKEDGLNPSDNQLNVDRITSITTTSGGIPVNEIMAESEFTANIVATALNVPIKTISSGILRAGHAVQFGQTAYVRPEHFDYLKQVSDGVRYVIQF